MKTRECSKVMRDGRLAKGEQFALAAELLADDPRLGDAYVTNCVHAGIAAADVLCCAALGRHAYGDNHQDAVRLLEQVTPGGPELARSLSRLLSLKTQAGYTAQPVSADDRKRATRALDVLMEAARERALGT